ncbi:hypothetical protein [Sediminicola arcticus]|jgi:uncharacterized protein GlcG (DUF336 family)|uniref:Heme-binding protein n=1 Tax=Sediminicola arcticus TaxID=1574308 RepID=A0ABV2SU12_9FLAO
MEQGKLNLIIQAVFKEIEVQIPNYKNSPEDWNISEGNVAMCIITEEGAIYGKLFGTDKIRQRQFYKVAWTKASQVWITGHSTGDYEKIVFGGGMDPEDAPIELPDLIGWVGGQPLTLADGTLLSIGFSGFRGFNDIAIVKEAFKKVTS